MVLSGIAASSPVANASPGALHGWKLLAPLPDKTGFGGMFAGVLDGVLVAGGGTQWDKPVWLEGKKLFSDRVFGLQRPDGDWEQLALKLPVPSGHFATAASANAIYLAGGISAEGCLGTAWELQSNGGKPMWRALPSLPAPIGYGAAAIAGGRLYVVGGMRDPAARSALREVWSLGLERPAAHSEWRREPDLPGSGVFVPMAASDGAAVYVFGGMEFDTAEKYKPSRAAYRLGTTSDRWEVLPDLPEPRVGATGPGQALPGGQFLVIGGYAEVFPGAMRDHPGFSRQTYLYNIATRQWQLGPLLPVSNVPDPDAPGDPWPSPMIGAASAVWRDQIVVISGEVRGSVRSPVVLAWPSLHPVVRDGDAEDQPRTMP